jgi:hypothetical protein
MERGVACSPGSVACFRTAVAQVDKIRFYKNTGTDSEHYYYYYYYYYYYCYYYYYYYYCYYLFFFIALKNYYILMLRIRQDQA